jgi:cytochrome c5
VKLAVISRGVIAALAMVVPVSVLANAELIERIKPVGEVCMAGDACSGAVKEPVAGVNMAVAEVNARSGQNLYETKCGACHSLGVAGAPKLDDLDAWKTRLDSKGLDGLFNSVWNGLNVMPPKGTCNDCSEEEIKSAIKYMVGN